MPALYRRDSLISFEQEAYPTYFDDQLYLVWYPPYEEPSDDDDEEEQQQEEEESSELARGTELEPPAQRVPPNTPVSQAVDRGEGSGNVEGMKLDGKGEASEREEAKKMKKKTAGDVVDEAIESRFLLESTAEDEENQSDGGGEGLGDEEACCEEHGSGWFSQDGRFVCQ